MTASLSGKRILYFGPETFNYEHEIAAQLERMGAQVVFRSDKPGDSFLLKVLLRLFPRILWRYSDRVFGKWLADKGPPDCDVVFVVKGEGLSPKFIDHLRRRYKSATFILYLWDSLRNVRDVELKFFGFDQLFSFDRDDCNKHPCLAYRPLFFLEQYRSTAPVSGHGCFFIGTLNGDRPAVISRLIEVLPRRVPFDYWLFVRDRTELTLRRLFDTSLRHLDPVRLLRAPMPAKVVSQHFQSSAAIVDIEHPRQGGLTMRTFEVLASGKKLITTNKTILGHDFYDPSRICVIDRKKPCVADDFVEAPTAPLPAQFFETYSLSGWLSDIFRGVTEEDLRLVKATGSGRRVLVTGANGFIGRAVCADLPRRGYHVLGAVRKVPDMTKGLNVQYRAMGDITEQTDWSTALSGVECVLHLAARVHIMRDSAHDPLAEFRRGNVAPTLNLARQAANAGVRRFVFISSVKVNGESTPVGHPFTADDMPQPLDPYGVSKLEAEQGLIQLAHQTGMEVVIIRPVLVYGPGVKANFQEMMRWLQKGDPMPLGALGNYRSMVALDNVVDCIATCLHHPAAANQVFLVSDGEDLTVTGLLRRTAAAFHRPARLLPVPAILVRTVGRLLGKEAVVQRLCDTLQVDITKTRRLLGWEPPVSVDAALKKTVRHYRDDQGN